MTSGCSYWIFCIKNICASRCRFPWSSKYATATLYFEPTVLSKSICLLWNLNLVDFCTSGTSYGPSGLIYSCTVLGAMLSSTRVCSMLYSGWDTSYKIYNSTITYYWMVWSYCLGWISSWSFLNVSLKFSSNLIAQPHWNQFLHIWILPWATVVSKTLLWRLVVPIESFL